MMWNSKIILNIVAKRNENSYWKGKPNDTKYYKTMIEYSLKYLPWILKMDRAFKFSAKPILTKHVAMKWRIKPSYVMTGHPFV